MSARQRLVFLAIAAVIAVVAVVALAGGSGDEQPTTAGTTTAEGTPAAEAAGTTEPQEAEPASTPEPKPPLLTAADPRTVRVEQGERVEFRVRHDVADEIHVHGYDIYEDVPAGKTITVSFKADLTGIWEVELHDAVKPVGSLRVEPK